MLSIKTVREDKSAISSHRDNRGSKMRILILSAFLACAAAAPSGLLAPVAVPVAYTSIVPTISPGDIQAAAINAQVKAQDLVIAEVDRARQLSDLAVENLNEQSVTSTDQVKEKVGEQFWSVEEQKWQALDALKTAEAQIDGSVANNADALAKSAISAPVVTLPAISAVPAIPLPAPVAFTPGIVAPVLKAAEEPKEEPKESAEAAVKTAEEAKDSVTVEAEKIEEKPEVKLLEVKPVVPEFKYPIVAPIVSPVLKYSAVPYGFQAISLPQPLLTPAVYNPVYNTVW